jgi:hypothetical protein
MNIDKFAKQMNTDQPNDSTESNETDRKSATERTSDDPQRVNSESDGAPVNHHDLQAIESPPASPVITIMTNAARFELGQVVATPAAIALLKETGFSAAMLIARHLHGDFGDICAEDAAENEISIKHGFRIMSVYRLVPPETLKTMPAAKRTDLPTIWLITDADRSSTCLLLPSEY